MAEGNLLKRNGKCAGHFLPRHYRYFVFADDDDDDDDDDYNNWRVAE